MIFTRSRRRKRFRTVDETLPHPIRAGVSSLSLAALCLKDAVRKLNEENLRANRNFFLTNAAGNIIISCNRYEYEP